VPDTRVPVRRPQGPPTRRQPQSCPRAKKEARTSRLSPGGTAVYSTGAISKADVDVYIAKFLRPFAVTNGWGLACPPDYLYLVAASHDTDSELYVDRTNAASGEFQGHAVPAPPPAAGLVIDSATCDGAELSTASGSRLRYSVHDDKITGD
jgi:hypothetical protein